jgi:hypothetical protein
MTVMDGKRLADAPVIAGDVVALGGTTATSGDVLAVRAGRPMAADERPALSGIGTALSIGINNVDATMYDGWSGPLRACENDARAMARIAADLGYTISILPTDEARADVVLDRIRDAAARLRPGDTFLLTYAGHGTTVPDLNGDEPGVDEAWVFYDRLVIDDEIRELLDSFLPGVWVVCVLDMCYAAGATDAVVPGGSRGPSARFMPPEKAAAALLQHPELYAETLGRLRRRRTAPTARGVALAACAETEVAGEDAEHGYFTRALLDVWDGGTFIGPYPAFQREITGRMPAGQHPELRMGTDLPWAEQRPFVLSVASDGRPSASGRSGRPSTTPSLRPRSDEHDNWADVLPELVRRGEPLTAPAVSVGDIAAAGDVRARGGVVVRTFWWGFHIEIDHPTLVTVLNAADTANTLIGLIGGGVPSPAAPFIAAAAAFVAGSIAVVRSLDAGNGVYISMSWFAPGVFIPTTVPTDRGGEPGRKSLGVGARLVTGEVLEATDGRTALTLRPDGDLVVVAASGETVWSTGTHGQDRLFHPVAAEVDAKTGALSLVSEAGLPVWSTGSDGAPNARLVLENGGNIVVRDVAGNPVWQSAPGPAVGALRDSEVRAFKASEVGWGKRMESTATLYRDGTLVLNSMTKNDSWVAGLRGRTLIIVRDDGGRAIWVSQIFEDPTRCSVPDVSCASWGRYTFVQHLPAAVGIHAAGLDVYHGDEPVYADLRARIIEMIKTAVEIADAVKAVVGELE